MSTRNIISLINYCSKYFCFIYLPIFYQYSSSLISFLNYNCLVCANISNAILSCSFKLDQAGLLCFSSSSRFLSISFSKVWVVTDTGPGGIKLEVTEKGGNRARLGLLSLKNAFSLRVLMNLKMFHLMSTGTKVLEIGTKVKPLFRTCNSYSDKILFDKLMRDSILF